jgi:DNA (cytosine-5)-methyltransferase 1
VKPRLLDLCCKEGGAGMGYHQAGFDVVGVDIDPQPRYPFRFIRADALDVLTDRRFTAGFDLIHASWPCQAYSPLNALPSTKNADEHPDLLGPGRELMRATGRPWVIENVMSAPLRKDMSITLCGGMFGLRTYRHRRFESPLPLRAPPHPKHVIRTATKRRKELWAQGWHVSITGDVGTYVGPEAMGIDWMSGDGLSEAIPPAYTRLVGRQALALLSLEVAA